MNNNQFPAADIISFTATAVAIINDTHYGRRDLAYQLKCVLGCLETGDVRAAVENVQWLVQIDMAEGDPARERKSQKIQEVIDKLCVAAERLEHACQTCFDGDRLPSEALDRHDESFTCPECKTVYEPGATA